VSTPDPAVVIATRNRPRRLEALLHSLAAQGDARFEVIVVDDGSSDRAPEVLARGVPGLELRTIRHPEPRGPAASRNAGWRAAKAPLVVFADDDVVADPGWIPALVAAHRERPGAVLQGRTEPVPSELERSTAFWRSIRVEGVDPFFPTCNIAYPRELLERLGGFDEAYRRPAGEDTDLGWRARQLGAEPAFVPDALVHHAVHQMGLVAMVRDAARLADNVRVATRHPGLRKAFHRGVFWHPAHERVLALLAGVALARRTGGVSLVMGAPYAVLYRRHHRHWAGTIASLPGYAAVDLAQIASLAWASARHRTLLL
jgi:glycosyltransferase involved in cell wall biosynthesis